MITHSSTRRSFVRNGLASVLATGSAPLFIPASVLGQASPSRTFTLGCIGMGKHGVGVNMRSFLHEEGCRIVAVCDVFRDRREKAAAEVNRHYKNSDCAAVADFRALLSRPDIDAVVISTPDHWHVTMALLALQAGKHVFCEKPTLTIDEGRRLVQSVAKSGKVFCTGLEDRSLIHYHRLVEIVRNGDIGTLKHIKVGLPTKPIFPKQDPAPVPGSLNFPMWLGPAPERDFFPTLTDDQVWRQIRDFSGGSLTDWGAHLMDTAQVGNFSENSGPVTVSGKGTIPPDSINTVPRDYTLDYTFANGVTMEVKSAEPYIRFEGDKGWVGCTKWVGKMEASDMQVYQKKYDPSSSKIWPLPPREHRNFIDCLQGKAAPTYSAESLHRLSTAMHTGLIAMELGQKVHWDPEKETFQEPDANALRTRIMREDWKKLG
ncbi:MAG: Gfo/Idh/MocA family oxidoreductase [Verrucomicrobiaceae bacterium]|nr:Gfo/Idh/MocA family oxidoreductase [Verrucomicrobiaceae bacterium]